MRENIRNDLKKIIRKKWFWVGVVVFFILAIITDLVISITFVLTNFYSERWDPYLLAIGVTSAILGAFAAKNKFLESKNLREIGKLLFFIALIWVFKDHGFFNMMIFMAGILITTRILKWFTPRRGANLFTPKKSRETLLRVSEASLRVKYKGEESNNSTDFNSDIFGRIFNRKFFKN